MFEKYAQRTRATLEGSPARAFRAFSMAGSGLILLTFSSSNTTQIHSLHNLRRISKSIFQATL